MNEIDTEEAALLWRLPLKTSIAGRLPLGDGVTVRYLGVSCQRKK